MTGRNTTGPPRAAPVSYVAPWNVTDDDRRQTYGEQNNTGPVRYVRRASSEDRRSG